MTMTAWARLPSTVPDAPEWRVATPEETALDYAGEVIYSDAGGVLEVRRTFDGTQLQVLDGGPTMPCGCMPHVTYMRGIWGFYCETEDQGYCNFECPHEEEDE